MGNFYHTKDPKRVKVSVIEWTNSFIKHQSLSEAKKIVQNLLKGLSHADHTAPEGQNVFHKKQNQTFFLQALNIIKKKEALHDERK